MNFEIFKKKFPILFWRGDISSDKQLLSNIIQLENKKALKYFIEIFGFDYTKKNFLDIREKFVSNPDIYLRYQRMYNWFIFYKKKKLGIINDMRKYKYWWLRK